MGRTDEVAFLQECIREWRALGAVVEGEPGWESRGNGDDADYEGGLIHHTAAPSSSANPFPSRGVLLNGRAGLAPPLCNVAGPWCPVERPLLRVMAAYPANHAGASGGYSMGPLPRTTLFNRRVLGLEIDYAGTSPMSPGQYRAAVIYGAGVTRVLRRPSPEWIRGHAETSITGKWDPGYAPPARTIDLNAYRRDVWGLAANPNPNHRPAEDLMYVKCQPDPSRPAWVAILSGPMFVGLGSGGEIRSAEAAIAAGATVQWVELATWNEFDRRSHALCDNPRPVVLQEPAVASRPEAGTSGPT